MRNVITAYAVIPTAIRSMTPAEAPESAKLCLLTVCPVFCDKNIVLNKYKDFNIELAMIIEDKKFVDAVIVFE